MITALGLFVLVLLIEAFFKTKAGEKIGNFLPTPFWIYFIPMVLATVHLLPQNSPVFGLIGLHLLPMALVLLLIGTPVTALFKLGGKATAAMALGSATVIMATFISFPLLIKILPPHSSMAAAALLATWVGGSANMIVIKEAISMPDQMLAPLIIVDTFLSYGWMAILMLGVNSQKRFDGRAPNYFSPNESEGTLEEGEKRGRDDEGTAKGFRDQLAEAGKMSALVALGFFIAEMMVMAGRYLAYDWTMFNDRAWTLLLTTTAMIFLAMTPLRKMERWGASRLGKTFLYVVLASIGARTTLQAAGRAPAFLLLGVMILIIHGVLLLAAGRFFKIPLFLLATSSQANIGGPISAPIVAGVYQPGSAQFGVIMGIVGNLIGTYVGLFGYWVCRHLEHFLGR